MRQGILTGLILILTATTAMAAQVEVIPFEPSTPQAGASCNVVAGRCDLVTSNTNFSVLVRGLNQPQTAGATLGLTFSPGAGMDWTAADLASVPPMNGLAFGAIVATPDPGTTALPIAPVTACDNFGDCIVTVLAPTAGTLPSGTVPAFVLKFAASAPGTYLIDILDDGGDFSWSDANAQPIPNTYTQARVTVIPLPAATWLFGSALALLAWVRRKLMA